MRIVKIKYIGKTEKYRFKYPNLDLYLVSKEYRFISYSYITTLLGLIVDYFRIINRVTDYSYKYSTIVYRTKSYNIYLKYYELSKLAYNLPNLDKPKKIISSSYMSRFEYILLYCGQSYDIAVSFMSNKKIDDDKLKEDALYVFKHILYNNPFTDLNLDYDYVIVSYNDHNTVITHKRYFEVSSSYEYIYKWIRKI